MIRSLVPLFFVFLAGAVLSQEAIAGSNFRPAKVVIGQNSFSGSECNQGSGPDANTLCQPYGTPGFAKQILFGSRVLYKDVLFVPDNGNHRVLAFQKIPKKNDASAILVLGQPNFTTNALDLTGRATLDDPACVVAAGDQLFVTDTREARALIWNRLPVHNLDLPDIVLGQTSFANEGSQGPTQSSLGQTQHGECGMSVVNGKLLINDSDFGRIMIWDTIPTANDADADVVVGAPDFTGGGIGCSPMQSGGFCVPQGIWSDGNKLILADTFNNRVLIWNSIPTVNNAPADIVIGQTDFNSNAHPHPPTAQSLSAPVAVASDGRRLFVDDSGNNRVLVYSPFPTSNNPAASMVLGQRDFVHGSENAGDSSPSAQTLSSPSGLLLLGKQLIVMDSGNNRVLIFNVR